MAVATALALTVAAAAFACANAATLVLSANSGPAGAVVGVTGTGYATTLGAPVVLHWNGVDGPELGRTMPNAKGEISLHVTVPQAPPGYYVVISVLRNAAGVDAYGTPSRASFQILAPGASAATTAPPPTTVAPTSTIAFPPGLPLPVARTPTPAPPTPPTVPPTTAAAPPTSVAPAPALTPVAAEAVAARRPAGGDDQLPAIAVAFAVVLLASVAVGLGRTRLRSR